MSNITLDRIIALAEEKGVSFEFLNDLIGAYPGKTDRWKSGRLKPTFSELNTLSSYFGVPLDYLLGHSPHPATAPPEVKVKLDASLPAATGQESFIHVVDSRGRAHDIPIPPNKADRFLKLIEAAFPEWF